MKGPKLEWFEIILANVTQQFKKLQIRLFKLQISPMGNITCRQTCNHSKTLSAYCYVSEEKKFCEIFVITFLWSMWQSKLIWALCDHKLLFKEPIQIV